MTTAVNTEIELTFGFEEVAPAPAEEIKEPKASRGKKSDKVAEAKEPKAPRAPKGKPEVVLTVPNQRTVAHRDRVDEIWTDLKLHLKDGFYQVSDRNSGKEKGVIGFPEVNGSNEVRIPFDIVKGLFRSQYVSDMQAEHPSVLASIYMVYFESASPFAYITQDQFNALDVMLAAQVTRRYTYHDMADNKRGYTFHHQDFPSIEEQEKFRMGTADKPVERRVEAPVEEPILVAEPAQVQEGSATA